MRYITTHNSIDFGDGPVLRGTEIELDDSLAVQTLLRTGWIKELPAPDVASDDNESDPEDVHAAAPRKRGRPAGSLNRSTLAAARS